MEELELVKKNEGARTSSGFASDIVRSEPSVLEEASSATPTTLLRARNQNGGRRNPPARNTSRFWFERFLAVIQRQNPSLIDSSFLSQVAPNNEGKLLAQLKFLHVIDDEGKPTDLLSMLNMIGAEQKKGFEKMIKESYGELMAEIVIAKAVPEDVINFFIRHYSFTRDKAINAAKFFLYLCEKGSLSVSSELSSLLTEKSTNATNQTSPTTTSSPNSMPRLGLERPSRSIRATGVRRARHDLELNAPSPSIQTTINITLDKDTPREYWDRVLALLGEGGRNGRDGGEENQLSDLNSQQNQSQLNASQLPSSP
jgi:hypothetical protein